MDLKARIAAKKAEQAAGTLTPAVSAAAPAASSSRASRFRSAGLDDGNVDPDDEQQPEAAAVTTVSAVARSEPPAVRTSHPPSPPANTPVVSASRAERFKMAAAKAALTKPVSPAQQHHAPAQPAQPAQDEPAPPWDDPDRPAGSAYTPEEWLQAEADHPGQLIMEMIKPTEHGLIAVENNATNQIFKRSLVVDLRTDSPWISLASCKVEHYGEFGTFRYAVIRSKTESDRAPWLNGSTLKMGSDSYPEPDQSQQKSRSQRYR